MKKAHSIILFIFLFCGQVAAQKIEKYFDYNWKECSPSEARFYAIIEKKDSGWLRQDYFLIERKLQMKGLYKDSACTLAEGAFYYFHSNGETESFGKYRNNKKQGMWLGFHSNGMISDSSVYEEGKRTSVSLQWHANGYMSDSTFYNTDGSAVQASWFDDGTLSSAGRLNPLGQLHGKWQFFHSNGQLSAAETYNNGQLEGRQYYSEDGKAMQDTTDRSHPAIFAGGIPGWMRYLEKHLYFPSNYRIVNAEKAAIVVAFTVDAKGNVTDVNLPTPFHPVLNDITLRVFRDSPKWIPAMNHNRRVKYNHRQSVTFTQQLF